MVEGFIGKENGVFDEDGAGPQDEGEEEVDVNVVPGAVKLPAERKGWRHLMLNGDPVGGACGRTSHRCLLQVT